jgi:RNA polymerase sigma-70 factor (ECF subfamily)
LVEQLLREAQTGSRRAFGEIAEMYRGELLRYAASRTGPQLRGRLEPEDVVQDALRVAFEGLERFEWRGPQSLGCWLRGIVEHRIRNASRGREARLARISLESLLEPAASGPSPSRVVRREERFERLQRALQGLSPDHRQVIELARLRGLKIREIADRMGRSEAAVKKLLSRALEDLRERFGDTVSSGLPARALEPEAWAEEAPASEPSKRRAGSGDDPGVAP